MKYLALLRWWIVPLVILSSANMITVRHWMGELNRNFAGYYLVGAIFAIVTIAMTRRHWSPVRALLLIAILVVINIPALRALAPFYSTASITEAAPQEVCKFSIATVNVGIPHTSHLMNRWLDSFQPDVLAIVEWVPAVSGSLRLRERYPYVEEVRGSHSHGLALASFFPFVGPIIRDVGDELMPILHGRIDPCSSEPIALTALHAFPPTSARRYHLNQLLFRRLAMHYRAEELGPAIVLGDFNSTPFSDLYGRIPVAASFGSVFWGFGLPVTWNAKMPLARFAIDHIFVRGAFTVDQALRGPFVGSDHYPVAARLRFTGQKSRFLPE